MKQPRIRRPGDLGVIALWLLLGVSIHFISTRAAVTLEMPMHVEQAKSFPVGSGGFRGLRALPGGGLILYTFPPVVLTHDLVPLSNFNSPQFQPPLGIQPDGRFVVKGTTSGIVRRINWDGSFDPTFAAPPAASGDPDLLQDIVVQPDGKILVACGISQLSVLRVMRDGLFRLNADGTVDGSFSFHRPTTPIPINQVIVRPDGRILARAASGVLQLMPNGSQDPAFPGIFGDASLSTMARYADGRILVSGFFQSINGIPCDGFARLDANGNFDFNFAPQSGAYSSFLAIQTDGRILAASGNAVWRYFSDGSQDTSFFYTAGSTYVALDETERIFLSGGGFVSQYSGKVRVVTPTAAVDATLERSSLVDGGWVQVQSIPANQKLDFVDTNFPGTQNVFYRARPTQ